MRKRGNISVVLLTSLVVLLAGSAIIAMSVNSKFAEKQSYERIANRYTSESGIDMAIGLFEKHLAEQDFVVTYTKNADGSYTLLDDYSPYLLDEIRQGADAESIAIESVSSESADYLASIGFLEFKRMNGIQLSLGTFYQKESFKLSRMCVELDFLVSGGLESGTIKSKTNPVYLTVKSSYKGGEVLCSAEISGIYLVREPFTPCGIGELASVRCWIDTTKTKVTYVTYQNYRRGGEI